MARPISQSSGRTDRAPAESRRGGGSTRRPHPKANATGAGADDLCEVACIDGAKVALARAALPGHDRLVELAEVFRAIGDPTRLRLVAALATKGVKELCVCDLAALVSVSQSAVSHSLRTLRELRIVKYRKVGKVAYYSLDDAHVVRLLREGMGHVHEPRVGQ